jgi:hypothetical protein
MVGYEEKVIGLKEHCIYASVGDEVVLLDADKKIYYTINGPAALIVSTLSGENDISFADLKAKLMSKYTVTEEAAATELKGFLDELARLGFLMQDAKISMEKPRIVQTGDVLSKVATYIVPSIRVRPRFENVIAVAKKNS